MLRPLLTLAALVAVTPAAFAKPVVIEQAQLMTLIDEARAAVNEAHASVAKGPRPLVPPNLKAALTTAKARLAALEKLAQSAPDAPTPCSTPTPPGMPDAAFATLRSQVSAASFAPQKLGLIRDAASANRFTVAQAIELLKVVNFPEDKLAALGVLVPVLVDLSASNRATIINHFTFAKDKERAEALVPR